MSVLRFPVGNLFDTVFVVASDVKNVTVTQLMIGSSGAADFPYQWKWRRGWVAAAAGGKL